MIIENEKNYTLQKHFSDECSANIIMNEYVFMYCFYALIVETKTMLWLAEVMVPRSH
jgi:hypothetical protein